jgi:hypothetical protein
MRKPRKPLPRIAKPPTLSLGIVLFGVAAVAAASGALVRYYGRERSLRTPRVAADAAVEIPAPELLEEPAQASSATKP